MGNNQPLNDLQRQELQQLRKQISLRRRTYQQMTQCITNFMSTLGQHVVDIADFIGLADIVIRPIDIDFANKFIRWIKDFWSSYKIQIVCGIILFIIILIVCVYYGPAIAALSKEVLLWISQLDWSWFQLKLQTIANLFMKIASGFKAVLGWIKDYFVSIKDLMCPGACQVIVC